MSKGHNLMDLAFFILKMYLSCTEIHVHITPDVSGTKFYNKIFVTLYGFTGLEGYLFTFLFFFSSLESGGQNIYLFIY
jgi:hypothetical protein